MEIKPFLSSSKSPDRLYIKRVRNDSSFPIQIVIFRMLRNNADAHISSLGYPWLNLGSQGETKQCKLVPGNRQLQPLSKVITWLKWPDMKEADCVRLFAIAFSKVFDSVSQAIIFNKLKEVSINPYIIYWIIFFPRRLQRLVSNGTMSSFWSIIRGVPQGTILGPVYLN